MAILQKEQYQKSGNWLSGKSPEISTKPNKPTIVTITGFFNKTGTDFNGKESTHDCITVDLNGDEFCIQLNKTNMSTLLSAFEGDSVDTDDFVGLPIMLYSEPLPQDKTKKVLKLLIDDDVVAEHQKPVKPSVAPKSTPTVAPKQVASVTANDEWRLKTIDVVRNNIAFIISEGISFPYQLGNTKVPNGHNLCDKWDSAKLAKYAHLLDQIIEAEGIISF